MIDARLSPREPQRATQVWLRAIHEAAALVALPFFHIATVVVTSARQQIEWRA